MDLPHSKLQSHLKKITEEINLITEEILQQNTEFSLHNQRLGLVNQIGQLIISSLDYEVVLERLITELVRAFDVERGSFWLVNYEKNTVEPQLFDLLDGFEDTVIPSLHDFPHLKLGEGYVGKAALTGQASFSNNIPTDKEHHKKIDQASGYQTKSLLTIPIRRTEQDKVIAVVQLLNPRNNEVFTLQDIEVMQLLSPWIIVALDNAKHYNLLNQQNRTLQTVNKIGQVIVSTLDYKTVLERLMFELIHEFDVERGSFWVIDRKQNTLTPRFSLNIEGSQDSVSHALHNFPPIKLGEGYVGQAALTGQSSYSNSLTQDSNHFKKIDQTSGFQTKSLLTVPVYQTEQTNVMAVVQLLNPRNNRLFASQDVELMNSLIPWIASAITNAELYAQVDTEKVKTKHFANGTAHIIKGLLGSADQFLYNALKSIPEPPIKMVDSFNRLGLNIKESIAFAEALCMPYQQIKSEDMDQIDLCFLLDQSIAMLNIPPCISVVNMVPPQFANVIIHVQYAKAYFSEILINAIDAILKTGEKPPENYKSENYIKLEAELLPHNHIQLLITNSGSEIKKELWEIIFEAFFSLNVQKNQSTVHKTKNFGLGLSGAKTFFQRDGGDVYVKSSENLLTTFAVIIPCKIGYGNEKR
jgi:GAF domain-containing protein